MKTILPRLGALSAILFATFFTAACAHNLFDDKAPPRRSQIDRYYDGDSAFDTTANRKRASDTGFGFPTGGTMGN